MSYLHLLFLIDDQGGSTDFIDARIARLLDDRSLRQATRRIDPRSGTQAARIAALFRDELAARAARTRRRAIAAALLGLAAIAAVGAIAGWVL